MGASPRGLSARHRTPLAGAPLPALAGTPLRFGIRRIHLRQLTGPPKGRRALVRQLSRTLACLIERRASVLGLTVGSSWRRGRGRLNTRVNDNTSYASGRIATARGGGIFDVSIPNGVQGGPLTLVNSTVQRNILSGSRGANLHGGGIFAGQPVTLRNTIIRRNSPDQCYGCRTATSAAQSSGGPGQRTIGRPTFPRTLLDWLPTDAYRGLR